MGFNSTDKQLSIELYSTDKQLSIELYSTDKTDWQNEIPLNLQELLQKIGQRANKKQMFDAIVSLCQWRDLSSRQLYPSLCKVFCPNKISVENCK